MPMLRLRKPSPALFISCLALFVALSGSSYAVIVLPKNSVGTKQLKKSAVTSAKVKNNALTGADVNEATLGQVPSAASAGSASTLAGNAEGTYLRSDRCRPGSLHGWALVNTTSSTYENVATSYNCANGPVQARRFGLGSYYVRFVNNGSFLAVGAARLINRDVSIEPMVDGLDGLTSFRVITSLNGSAEDVPFTIVTY